MGGRTVLDGSDLVRLPRSDWRYAQSPTLESQANQETIARDLAEGFNIYYFYSFGTFIDYSCYNGRSSSDRNRSNMQFSKGAAA